MAPLANSMPLISLPIEQMKQWGREWLGATNSQTRKPKTPQAFDKQQSVNFADLVDQAFANSLAAMLGNIPVVNPNGNSLLPPRRIALNSERPE